MTTFAQRLIQKGKQQGIDQGRRAERDELLTQWRELAQSLLAERFGSLPEEITARVAAAEASELKQWTGRIHKSETLDEVFDPAT